MYPLEIGNESASEKNISTLLWKRKGIYFFSNQRKMYKKHSKFAIIRQTGGSILMPNVIKNQAQFKSAVYLMSEPPLLPTKRC